MLFVLTCPEISILLTLAITANDSIIKSVSINTTATIIPTVTI